MLARFRAGDRSAFEALVKKHQPRLRQLAFRYVKNDEAAKDVVQTAFTRAFEKLDGFVGKSTFRTWLYRIAVNEALNHVRGAPQHDELPADDIACFTSALGTSRLVAGEVWRKVSARLERLPPKQRLVVELRLFHELSFDEVAAIAGSSEDAAKANFHHAVKRLRGVER